MSSKIVSYKDYVAGWLDTSVQDFLEALSPSASSTKYALITCLDSHPNPASLREKSPELTSIATKLEVRGTALFLPTKALVEAASSRQIFFGFDEVWFFPNDHIRPKPPVRAVVGPARLNQSRLEKVGEWMSENACSLALGGGVGLNFVVRAHGLVRCLLGTSIEQNEAVVSA